MPIRITKQAGRAADITHVCRCKRAIVLLPESSDKMLKQLATAQANLEADSSNVENWIWVGRRMAYLAAIMVD